MRSTRPDQAEGLRRLQSGRSPCAVIALAAAAADVGKRTIAVNLATTLAAGGRKVVLLQGARIAGAASGPMTQPMTQAQATRGLCAQLDAIAAALQGSREPSVAALDAPELFLGLPLWRSTQLNQVRSAMARISAAAGVLLVDTPIDAPCEQAQALGARSVTLVVTPSRAAITATYRMLKSLRPDGQQPNFQVIVNKAQDLDQARRVFDNIAYVVRRYLSGSIDFLGYLSRDNALRSAASARTVIERHPASPAARQLHALASGLVSAAAGPVTHAGSSLAAMRGEYEQTSPIHAISH
jgi:flagellar biosynthesis protein FlhG